MIVETACQSDIGCRQEQQDRVAVFDDDGVRVFVLADGMGGHEGGALAAAAVVEDARTVFADSDLGRPEDLLTAIALGAHERINAIGAARGISPHSTCVLLRLDGESATWAHVGDSRLYRFDNGRLAARTIDHSIVELMRLQGRITEREMKTHADQNRLYEALGGNEAPEVETGSAPISEDDGFLLASDGLWENVEDFDSGEGFRSRGPGRGAASAGGPGQDPGRRGLRQHLGGRGTVPARCAFAAVAARSFVASAALVMAPEAQADGT